MSEPSESDGRETTRVLRRSVAILIAWLAEQIEILDPGYFAMVMATAIISNAFFLVGPRPLADAMFDVTLCVYGALAVLTLSRLLRFARISSMRAVRLCDQPAFARGSFRLSAPALADHGVDRARRMGGDALQNGARRSAQHQVADVTGVTTTWPVKQPGRCAFVIRNRL
jgi:hypothetical protein